MSRWTNTYKNAYKYTHFIDGKKLLYKVNTKQGDFTITSNTRIDYKKTIKNLCSKGYTDIIITYIGQTI